jgi:ABC-2 type transport system ATP-binding protein
MADVEALCHRVIVIHHGTLLYDGDLASLVSRFSPYKTIAIEFSEPMTADPTEPAGARYGEIVTASDTRWEVRVPKADTATLASRLLADLPVADLTISEPPIEEVIEQVFATGDQQ